MGEPKRELEDRKVDVKIKLSALWASVMFCYLYGDYFDLYRPGALCGMLEGRMGPLGPTTQGILLGTSVMMAIPSVMVFLSQVMPPALNRMVNMILGLLYTGIILITARGWSFYIFLGVVEVMLTALVVWYAWRWPEEEGEAELLRPSPDVPSVPTKGGNDHESTT